METKILLRRMARTINPQEFKRLHGTLVGLISEGAVEPVPDTGIQAAILKSVKRKISEGVLENDRAGAGYSESS